MMAKLVAKGAEKSPVGRNLLANGSTSPDANERCLKVVVAKKLSRPTAFPDPEWPGRQNADFSALYFVEVGCDGQKIAAGVRDCRWLPGLHGGLDGLCAREQAPIDWHVKTY